MSLYKLKELGINKKIGLSADSISRVITRYLSPHRFYHGIDHIRSNQEKILALPGLSRQDKDILLLVNLYHDSVYIPWNPSESSLELLSAELFLEDCENKTTKIAQRIYSIILATHLGSVSDDPLSVSFNKIDREILYSNSLEELIEWENNIFKEYQFCPLDTYKSKRIEFLKKFTGENPGLRGLIDYITCKQYRIALYPGSFNPFHKGHLSVIQKIENKGNFDKVIVARGVNPEKRGNPENTQDLVEILGYREVYSYEGFLTKAVIDCQATAVLRGLRNGYDLNYEINQLRFLEDMGLSVPVFFVVCDEKYSHISSSAIRSLESIDPKKTNKYIPNYLQIL
jgi:pantetheine-phosphate adenylyltransferase